MSNKARQRVERMIARRIVLDAIRAGYSVGVFDGEEQTVRRSTTCREVVAALMTTDEDWLLLYRPENTTPQPIDARGYEPPDGWVRLVYGNDGWAVVCDYTTNLEPLMAGANALADKFSD